MTGEEAIRHSGSTANPASARTLASRWLTRVDVKAEIRKIQDAATDEAIMNLKERKIWLSNAIRTPINEITESSPLCVEKTVRTIKDGDGEGELVKIKKADPLRSMDLLNKLEGDYAPEKMEVSGLEDLFSRVKPKEGLLNDD